MSQSQSFSPPPAPAPADAPLQYQPGSGLLDEAWSATGELKPGWDYLLSSIGDLGAEVMRTREEKARRILRDDGATYNIYGKPGSPSASWE